MNPAFGGAARLISEVSRERAPRVCEQTVGRYSLHIKSLPTSCLRKSTVCSKSDYGLDAVDPRTVLVWLQ